MENIYSAKAVANEAVNKIPLYIMLKHYIQVANNRLFLQNYYKIF